jgi:hypothetical protein
VAKAAQTVRRWYIGAVDEVVVALPSGRRLTVARSGSVEVEPADAEALDLVAENWTASPPSTESREGRS